MSAQGESDLARSHRLQEQARKALQHGANPSPTTTYKWYVEQAENRDNSREDRKMWKALALELGERIKAMSPLTQRELQETHDPLF